jgi:predicted MPP superfamily phosphohydrolase
MVTSYVIQHTIMHGPGRRPPDRRKTLRPKDDPRSLFSSLLCWGTAAAAAAAGYMAFEARWIRCEEADLEVPGLPPEWSGSTVLHISDVHAGLFSSNEHNIRKAVDWAVALQPDLVLLTGDIISIPERSRTCLDAIARLDPPLGKFAVAGNHEYGIGKGPFARPRDTDPLWAEAGVTLLRDRCVRVVRPDGAALRLCGADQLTGGFGLEQTLQDEKDDLFSILLIHVPPEPASPHSTRFSLAFAGHTHGGQIRIPTSTGLRPVGGGRGAHLGGVYDWGQGRLVVSKGLGTSFVPMRLLTRPEVVLWRLV